MLAPNAFGRNCSCASPNPNFSYPFVNVLLTSLVCNRIRMKAGRLPCVVLALPSLPSISPRVTFSLWYAAVCTIMYAIYSNYLYF
jgi:hypothetical protein